MGRKHTFEIFHYEFGEKSRYPSLTVIDVPEVEGKPQAVRVARKLQRDYGRLLRAQEKEGRRLPVRIYYIRNLRTGKVTDYDGAGIPFVRGVVEEHAGDVRIVQGALPNILRNIELEEAGRR